MTKKILLADDSLTIQKVVELTFSDSDYDLVCVGNGLKALERVWAERPDLILADVVMPEKNGYEVCEAIKGNPATARIPVVLLSGTFEPFDRQRAERIGCDAIVSKPFDSQQLLSQVETLLARSSGGAADALTASAPAASRPAPEPEEEKEPFDSGFIAEDFTGSVRLPRNLDRVDPFEEEYRRGDADSAISAFESAQPEFPFGSGERGAAELAGGGAEMAEDLAVPRIPSRETPWLAEESDAEAGPRAVADLGAEEEVSGEPLAFESEPTAEVPFSESLRFSANDMPTTELPKRSLRELGLSDSENPPEEISASEAEILFDIGSSAPDESREEAAVFEQSNSEALEAVEESEGQEALFEASPGRNEESPEERAAEATPERGAEPREAARELEALAQTASIPELTSMLSSVMRSGGELSDAEIDRLASRVVEKLSDRILREIAWEVIPDMAEIVIKQRIKELEAGTE